MSRYNIFNLRKSMDAVNTTVGMTQDLLKTGRRFFATRSNPAQLQTDSRAHCLWTICNSSHIWSDYAEPAVHLTMNMAYLTQEAPDYYEVSKPSALCSVHSSSEHADSANLRNPGVSGCYA